MKINAINCVRQNYAGRKLRKVNNSKAENVPSFKGEQGQALGAAAGMLLGVASSFFVGPIGFLAISGAGLFGGAAAGDKIEDKIDEKKNHNDD